MMQDNKHILPRQEELLGLVNHRGYESIANLAIELNVSEQTVRRDIAKLDSLELLYKFRGGAKAKLAQVAQSKQEYQSELIDKTLISKDRSTSAALKNDDGFINKDINERETLFVKEKTVIAKLVRDILPNNAVIFLTIGTTMEILAKVLQESNKSFTVITDSIRVANNLYSNKNIKVILPAGLINHSNGGIEGPKTLDDLAAYRADYLITSVGGIEADGSLLDFNMTVIAAAQVMMKNSKATIVACDDSKFGAVASVCFASLKDVDFLVTNQEPSQNIKDVLEQNEVKLIVPKA